MVTLTSEQTVTIYLAAMRGWCCATILGGDVQSSIIRESRHNRTLSIPTLLSELTGSHLSIHIAHIRSEIYFRRGCPLTAHDYIESAYRSSAAESKPSKQTR